MIKDAVVNLPVGNSENRVVDFAVSVASTFDAHLAGVAFVYEPFAPMIDVAAIPADLIESQRIENENAAMAAISKFDEAARRAALSAESGKLELSEHLTFLGVSHEGSIYPSLRRLSPTKGDQRNKSSKRHYSTPVDRVLLFPTFKKPVLSSIASWCAGMGAVIQPVLPPMRCRFSSEQKWSRLLLCLASEEKVKNCRERTLRSISPATD